MLWKAFHYQLDHHPQNTDIAYAQYTAVNQLFAQAIAAVHRAGDVVWVNDYHLMLVPAMLRSLLPTATIGFFLHVPFPASEIFRCLPARRQLLLGMLGADLIGFQIYAFLRHFRMACSRILALDSNPASIQLQDSTAAVGIYPIGIDLHALSRKRSDPQMQDLVVSMADKFVNKKILIGRDKNDYVKGVRHKLVAYETFLSQHPEWVGKVVLIQVALSTSILNESSVSDVVDRINSKFGTIESVACIYLHQDISFAHYLALLTIADVCLITSLRDGMNLTSHEYVICQDVKRSPLVMSEFTGTYGSFQSALRVNPWNAQEVADAILEALTMSQDEKSYRWQMLYNYVAANTGTLQYLFSSNLCQ